MNYRQWYTVERPSEASGRPDICSGRPPRFCRPRSSSPGFGLPARRVRLAEPVTQVGVLHVRRVVQEAGNQRQRAEKVQPFDAPPAWKSAPSRIPASDLHNDLATVKE